MKQYVHCWSSGVYQSKRFDPILTKIIELGGEIVSVTVISYAIYVTETKAQSIIVVYKANEPLAEKLEKM